MRAAQANTKKFDSAIPSHPITSLRDPQWDQVGGTNRENKTGTGAESAGFIWPAVHMLNQYYYSQKMQIKISRVPGMTHT